MIFLYSNPNKKQKNASKLQQQINASKLINFESERLKNEPDFKELEHLRGETAQYDDSCDDNYEGCTKDHSLLVGVRVSDC